MHDKDKIFIVIAAYNEEKRLGSVLTDLKNKGYHNVVVVDDGSKDHTLAVAEKSNVHVLSHIFNRGQGAALKTGIDYALKKGANTIVTYDADGQFLTHEIEKIVAPIENKEADVVLGSRFLGKAVNMPFSKKVVLKLGVIVVFVLYGMKISDSQCGLRALSRNAAEKIQITADRMEHAAEFFSEIMRNNLKYKEIPITVLYDNYSLTKGQDWSHSFGLGLRMLFRKILR